MPGKLIVGFPLYHQVSAKFFTNYLKMDRSAVIDEIIIDGPPIVDAMNWIVGLAMENKEFDRLVVFEHDMIPPKDAFTRVAAYGPDIDIVGSFYFRHEPPHEVYVYLDGLSINPQTVENWCGAPALYHCHGIGMGFTSISRRVLENWDPDIPMFDMRGRWIDRDRDAISHDLWFCHHARNQGYTIYADSAIVCGHLTEVEIGKVHNEAVHKSAELAAPKYGLPAGIK